MKTNPVLPDTESERLTALRGGEDRSSLYAYVLALRQAGWPLRAIADPVGVSRMGVKLWEDTAKKLELQAAATALDVPKPPLMSVGSGVSAARRTIDVPQRDRQRLYDLQQLARLVRQSTPAGAPSRLASDELDGLLVKYVEIRGVQPMVVARHAGVTRRAIVARLERLHERQEAA